MEDTEANSYSVEFEVPVIVLVFLMLQNQITIRNRSAAHLRYHGIRKPIKYILQKPVLCIPMRAISEL